MRKCIIIILSIILMVPILVNAESHYLYDILKDEAENNGLAKEYTGEHHDSFTKEPSKKIYHWYAENGDEGNQVLEKNNVIFGRFCWQIVRTTDTGGVKLIYNGEPENGQCLNTRSVHIGYNGKSNISMSSTYYYGTDYIYDEDNNKFSLSGDVSTGEIKIGQYTCKKTSSTDTCTILNYVANKRDDNNYEYYSIRKNAHYATIGALPYNIDGNLGNLGYMYNKNYTTNEIDYFHEEKNIISSFSLSLLTRTWYSDSVNYNSTNGKYSLVNPSQISSTGDYSNLVGKYTLRSTNSDYSNTTVFYIVSATEQYIYYINVTGGSELNSYNDTYIYGTSYVDNGDNTYTINEPISFERFDWYDNYSALKNNYLCKNPINNVCEEIRYIHSSTNTSIEYYTSNDKYKFANNYTYENGVYTLNNDSVYIWNDKEASFKIGLNDHHYTCKNLSGTCSTISYAFQTNDSFNNRKTYYVDLEGEETGTDALNKMLYVNDVNRYDSILKSVVDLWYEKNLINYTDYLEDTIFCNNRKFTNLSNSGWNPNGGNVSTVLMIPMRMTLECPNETDKFSVANNKAKLTYPIGNLTYQEAFSSNNANIRKVGEDYWLMTPDDVYYNAIPYTKYVSSSGANGSSYLNKNNIAIRPAISLKSSARIISGTGNMENPYQLSFDPLYSINVEINNETENLTVEIEDLSQVEEGEIVDFNVTPIKGHKVTSIRIIDEDNNEIDYTTTNNKKFTFTMPSSNVTIIPSFEKVKNAVNVEDNINTKEFVIEVNDSSAVLYEDTVRFRVSPEEGYEVEDIDITDEEHNKINYMKTSNINEYEFTMPDTNVTIKPQYRKIDSSKLINPNTRRQIIFIIISIIVLGIITTIYSKKKRFNTN